VHTEDVYKRLVLNLSEYVGREQLREAVVDNDSFDLSRGDFYQSFGSVPLVDVARDGPEIDGAEKRKGSRVEISSPRFGRLDTEEGQLRELTKSKRKCCCNDEAGEAQDR